MGRRGRTLSDLHAAALRTLESWGAPTPPQERLRREFVAVLASHEDGHLRDCRPDHLTASALVLSADARLVLLMLHRRAGQWFQMGGHLEPGDDSLAAAALREAIEESGIERVRIDPVPVHLDRHEVPFCGGPGSHHLDVRFVAVAPEDAQPLVNDESDALRWWPVASLPSREPGLRELIDRSRARVSGRGRSTVSNDQL